MLRFFNGQTIRQIIGFNKFFSPLHYILFFYFCSQVQWVKINEKSDKGYITCHSETTENCVEILGRFNDNINKKSVKNHTEFFPKF